jgi:hypothetical protein
MGGRFRYICARRLNCLRRRRVMAFKMIREMEAEREQELVEKRDGQTDMIRALCHIRGIGTNVATFFFNALPSEIV